MIYFSAILLNFLVLYFFKSDSKYWLVSTIIWTLLILVFIVWRMTTDAQISHLDSSYWESAEYLKKINPENWRGDEKIFIELEQKKMQVKKINLILLKLIFLQTFLTFISQLIGYEKTKLKSTYKLSSIIFGILLILNFILFLLISIVPNGPFF